MTDVSSTDPLRQLVGGLARRLKPHGFRRSGSTLIRPGPEVYAKLFIQRTSDSTKADPSFWVNYGLAAVVLMNEFERSIADTKFGWCSWEGRLTGVSEHDGRRRDRAFRLSSYSSIDEAVAVVMRVLAPTLQEMLATQTVEAFLAAMEAQGPATGYRAEEIAKLKRHLALGAPD